MVKQAIRDGYGGRPPTFSLHPERLMELALACWELPVGMRGVVDLMESIDGGDGEPARVLPGMMGEAPCAAWTFAPDGSVSAMAGRRFVLEYNGRFMVCRRGEVSFADADADLASGFFREVWADVRGPGAETRIAEVLGCGDVSEIAMATDGKSLFTFWEAGGCRVSSGEGCVTVLPLDLSGPSLALWGWHPCRGLIVAATGAHGRLMECADALFAKDCAFLESGWAAEALSVLAESRCPRLVSDGLGALFSNAAGTVLGDCLADAWEDEE
ncbi:MAG: hypothetical protein N2109_12755 [Fimbriimonadales bacterium]|nr:hypothetical protein [Fimbriimonadales bacterium]